MKEADSNPVAPTTLLMAKDAPENVVPVAQPVASVDSRTIVANALAEAAQALLRAANAILGESFASPPKEKPLSHKSAPTPAPSDRLTVREVINEFLIVKARAARSDRYLRQLRVSLSSFAQGRGNTPLEDVTAAEMEKWIYGQKLRPKTMRNYLGDVKTLYSFAYRRQYIASKAAVSVELPPSDTKHISPAIHSPAETSIVLESLRKTDLNVMRLVAIRYFAGLRSAEAHRLREEHLKLVEGLIEVPALISKTRSRRLVTIQPNLAAWLALGGTLKPVGEMTVRKSIRLSGVQWKHNATRHSFVSYHLAKFQNAAKTALESGHDEAMLFSNYRAVVSEKDGIEFFEVWPKKS